MATKRETLTACCLASYWKKSTISSVLADVLDLFTTSVAIDLSAGAAACAVAIPVAGRAPAPMGNRSGNVSEMFVVSPPSPFGTPTTPAPVSGTVSGTGTGIGTGTGDLGAALSEAGPG